MLTVIHPALSIRLAILAKVIYPKKATEIEEEPERQKIYLINLCVLCGKYSDRN
jgi:hypothetical protein